MESQHGNAFDAAVTVALCLGVVDLISSGIGGGAFLLLHDAEANETEFIDAREYAPGAASPDMFADKPATASTDGALAVAIPGELMGLFKMHSGHGVLSWSDVVKPARDLAKAGFEVTPFLHSRIVSERDVIKQNAALWNLLTDSKGKALKPGAVLKRPELAATLTEVMLNGADAFYKGKLAEQMVQELEDAGGIITLEDWQNYDAVTREPLRASVNGFEVCGAPPPSSGGATIIAILRFLELFKEPYSAFLGGLSLHRLSEAMKHAFAMRMSLADPSFYGEIVEEVVGDMISGTYVSELVAMHDDFAVLSDAKQYGGRKWGAPENVRKAMSRSSRGGGGGAGEGLGGGAQRETLGFNYLEDHGTSHFSIVDKLGSAVAITTTVNTEFGSKFMSPSTGVLMNNEMDDFGSPGRPNYFGLPPSELNYPAPYKRPLSSMSPTIVFHGGKVRMVVGASGGPKIITATAQTYLNHVLAGKDLFESNSVGRIHDQLLFHDEVTCIYSDELLITGDEITLSERSVDSMKAWGHGMKPDGYLGSCQAISVGVDGRSSAVSDVRKGGAPAAFPRTLDEDGENR
jgi:gamma-glutamyltranspeptidase